MKRSIPWIVALVWTSASATAFSEDLPGWIKNSKISGYLFGDAYGVISHHDPAIEGENGFWFRRVYLTLDSKVSESADVRFRFEASSPGDFSTSKNLEPYLKDLYLRWKHGRFEAYSGLSSSPTWDLLESHWGYRQVEKTPLDLYKWGSSRDIGLAIKGAFDQGKHVRYHVMFANGEGTKSETDDGKKVMASFSIYPIEKWTIELYGDVDQRPGQTDRVTWQVFAGYKADAGRFGLQYAGQKREISSTDELDLGMASIYGAVKLGERAIVLGRVDRNFDPIPGGATIDYVAFNQTAEVTLALLGIDIALSDKVNLIPNMEAVFYDAVDAGPEPDTDLIGRLTLFAQF